MIAACVIAAIAAIDSIRASVITGVGTMPPPAVGSRRRLGRLPSSQPSHDDLHPSIDDLLDDDEDDNNDIDNAEDDGANADVDNCPRLSLSVVRAPQTLEDCLSGVGYEGVGSAIARLKNKVTEHRETMQSQTAKIIETITKTIIEEQHSQSQTQWPAAQWLGNMEGHYAEYLASLKHAKSDTLTLQDAESFVRDGNLSYDYDWHSRLANDRVRHSGTEVLRKEEKTEMVAFTKRMKALEQKLKQPQWRQHEGEADDEDSEGEGGLQGEPEPGSQPNRDGEYAHEADSEGEGNGGEGEGVILSLSQSLSSGVKSEAQSSGHKRRR